MKTQIIVITLEKDPEYFRGCEIHISSHGVLCIKKNNRYIKTYADGKWITAEEVNYV